MAKLKISEKLCPACGLIKPRMDFYQRNGNITYAKCKECHNIERRMDAQDPKRRAERLTARRSYSATRKDDPIFLEDRRLASNKYTLANKEKCYAAIKRWASANRGKINANRSKRRRENPEEGRRQNSARRARHKRAGGRISKGIADRLIISQKGKCVACRAELKITGYHLDHIVALARGGTNADSNIQLLCPTCNMEKHTHDHVEFMRRKGYLP